MKKIGFIDYYLDEWHANNYPEMIKKICGDEMVVAYAYGKIDSPIGGMTNVQWSEKYNVPLCASIEELVEKSDYIIVLSPDNSEMHEELSRIPLASHKNTFIDKTFAPTSEIAKRIFDYAEKNNTNCYSASALAFAPEYRAVDKSGIEYIVSTGTGLFDIYAVHQVEPLIGLMGTGIKKIMFMGGDVVSSYKLEYADGRGATLNFYKGEINFSMKIAYNNKKTASVEVTSEFFDDAIRAMLDFFRTGNAPVSHQATVEVMKVIEYGKKSAQTPLEWIEIK